MYLRSDVKFDKNCDAYLTVWSKTNSKILIYIYIYRRSHSLMFFKIGCSLRCTCKFFKKETLPHMFSCQFCKFFKNTFLTPVSDCFVLSNIKSQELPHYLRIRASEILTLKRNNSLFSFFLLLL